MPPRICRSSNLATRDRKGNMQRFGISKIALILFVFVAVAAIASPAQTLTTLMSFNYTDGAYPFAGLVQGTDGNFYGTTEGGGSANCDVVNEDGCGTIFKITAQGGFTSLYGFCTSLPCFTGYQPYAALMQASDGNFYGMTNQARGAVFQLTPLGVVNTLHNFSGPDGDFPYGALIQGSDGDLYGNTGGDEEDTSGTVFKITTAGTLTTLHAFSGPDGDSPFAALVQGNDGSFYGTTFYGGSNNSCDFGCGTVFKITSAGALTTIYNFAGSDGSGPECTLVQGNDGNFYGTTQRGGANSSGTVFKITSGGTLTTLYSFSGPDGSSPEAGLVLATDGNFYGTTYGGGSGGVGTIFKITPGGTLTTLHNFRSDGADGAYVASGLVQGTDGNLYGTTSAGGANAPDGTVFKLTVGGALIPTTTVLMTAPNPSQLGQSVTMTATVTAQDGSLPTGTVSFSSNGTSIGSMPLNNSGVAVLNYSELPVGIDSLTAMYQGSSTLAPSTSNTVQQVVNPDVSMTSVMSAPNPSTFGEQVTITATISPSGPPAPTGTVGFTSNGSAISGCTAVPLSSQMAVCMVSSLAIGTDTLVGTYSGDSNYAGSMGSTSQVVNPVPVVLQFVAAIPCRLVDTRNTGGPISGGTSRDFDVQQLGGCNIPSSAQAYSLNVTVVPQGPLGYLTIWPTGQSQPVVSTMNSPDGRVKANAAIVPAGANGAVSVFVSNTSDVVLDIDGYFIGAGSETLEFYPLPPCRVIDTRQSNGDLGSPSLSGGSPRNFPVLESSCLQGISNPQAYSFNFTVVPTPQDPSQPLGYLTVWPQGGSQPTVSTLNNLTATAVANAAIVPAATTGGISVFASNDTDMVVDINGYFAAPGTGGLNLYPVAPCRVLDTRNGHGAFSQQITVPVTTSPCAPPSSALAYVFNATVVPSGPLGYLTLWPDGGNQPTVSTLNALDGLITSNMAIVPSTDGSIDAFASNMTQLVLDISSYFAP